MRATLQSALSKLSIDKDARIVSGVKCMENNRDVSYRGADGKALGFRTNDGLINGLIQHAGNRTIPAHLTHDWTDGKIDGLHSRVGGVKNFRRDADGALLADYHAMPGEAGDRILWLAENDPEHAMLSLVFDYNKIESNGVTYAVPLNFEAADFVARGAAVSAMLSQLNQETDMTKDEIQALIDAGVAAKLKDFKPEGYITEAEAGERIKAALSAFKPEPTKATLTDEDMAKIVDAAQGALVAKLGGGPLLLNIKKENDANTTYTATLAKYMETSGNSRPKAVLRMLQDHPELQSVHAAAQAEEIAKLNAA